MKKIVSLALSLMLILGLCMVPTVSATDTSIFTDPVGSNWNLNGFYNVSDASCFSSVSATEVNPAWTNRDYVMKIEANNQVVSVYDAANFASFTKNNDKLYIQFDMYYPAYVTKDGEQVKNSYFQIYGKSYYQGAWYINDDGEMTLQWYGNESGYYPFGSTTAIPADTWYTITYVIDTDGTGYNTNTSEEAIENQTTATIVVQNEAGEIILRSKPLILTGIPSTYPHGIKMNNAAAGTGLLYLDNISFTTKNYFGITTESLSNVGANAGYVDVAMNLPVEAASLEDAKLMQNAAEVENVSFAKSPADATGKTVRMSWTDGAVTAGTPYTIDLSDITNIYGHEVGGTATLGFTPMAAPEFDITATFKKGLLGTTAITSLAEAAGSMVTANVTITSEVAEDFAATAFAGLYDANGTLVGCGFAGKTFANGESINLDVSLEVPEVTTGYSLKVFVCDSLSSIGAYGETFILN